MEVADTENEPLLEASTPAGGFKALPSIIVNESLEKVATYGLSSNMTPYLTRGYGMSGPAASYVLSFWNVAVNFVPVVAAFLADSSTGRYAMIGFGTITCFLGTMLLWLTAAIPEARPFCNQLSGSCESSSTASQLLLLYSSLALIAVGVSGLRSSSMAFGADQLTNDNNSITHRALESYISWYVVSVNVSILFGMSMVVYVEDHMGWEVGFGVLVGLMFLSVVSFFVGSKFYVKKKPSPSLITGLVQVAVASYNNRHVPLISSHNNVMYFNEAGSNLLVPSPRLRFLNTACTIKNPEAELTSEGRASDPWSLCSVEQVEGLKALINIIPIWSTGIVFSAASAPIAFSYLQVESMNRHITSNFEVPAGSFSVFAMIFLVTWIPFYYRLFLPLLSKIFGKPIHVGVKLRMGIGILFACLSLALSAVIENRRRTLAVEGGFADDPRAAVNMSAFWLLPMQIAACLAVAFNDIAQNEFYLSELPAGMSSIATTLLGLNMSVGSLVSSLIMKVVDNLSKGDGRESWVSTNINKAHFEYYYWILCAINVINFFYFLVCCKSYGKGRDEEDEAS